MKEELSEGKGARRSEISLRRKEELSGERGTVGVKWVLSE